MKTKQRKRWPSLKSFCSALALSSTVTASIGVASKSLSPLGTPISTKPSVEQGKNLSVQLISGLGDVHHPVSTTNPLAQRYFDQGFSLLYAFNHAEAIRSFKQALELDPFLAMAHWGVAYALGPNYNLEADQESLKEAFKEIQAAKNLASSTSTSEAEKAYINALEIRYVKAPDGTFSVAGEAYAQAMKDLSLRFAWDLDASTLYAEALMDLNPWKLWSRDGTPAPNTETIVATLERVLAKNPNHTGANHFYIHAVDASPHPEKALKSADRLGSLAPNAGHLVHMPAHIYLRIGQYMDAARVNEAAIETDRRFAHTHGHGIYAALYSSHNLQFLTTSYSMAGVFAGANKAALGLVDHFQPYLQDFSVFEPILASPVLVLTRFSRWNEILATPEPKTEWKVTHALWRFARGRAFAKLGQVQNAQAESQALVSESASVPESMTVGFTPAKTILTLADLVLRSDIARAKNDTQSAIILLQEAVAVQDALAYNEPPDWFYPVRESLGAALMEASNPLEAAVVFRRDLIANPRNGRSLFGLSESLKAQGTTEGALAAQLEFEKAWSSADTKLDLSSF